MPNSSQIQVPRRKKLPKYRAFKLNRKIDVNKVKQIPTVRELWKDSWRFMWLNRRSLLILATIYSILYFVLVKQLEIFSLEVDTLKNEIGTIFSGGIDSLIALVLLYSSLLSSITATADDASNFSQVSIIIIFSLAYIWLIRKLHGKTTSPTAKDALYQGMRPLIPFLIVIFCMLAELVPAGLGALLFTTVQDTVLGVTGFEMVAAGILLMLTLTLSIYLLAGSVFAPYIVTLPNTTPLSAINSSMKLLRLHRWTAMKKIIGFYLLLFASGFLVVLPFIIWLPKYSEIAFFVMSSLSFGLLHTFMYKLYRSLL